jgi:hypothetical protein
MDGLVNEAGLKTKLLEKARMNVPSFVWIRHEDRFTAGIPDLSVAGKGYVSWWEIKYAHPDFPSSGTQELMLIRLQGAMGRAFYIIYCEAGASPNVPQKHVRIVAPKDLVEWDTKALKTIPGFNHEAVVEYIKEAHSGS